MTEAWRRIPREYIITAQMVLGTLAVALLGWVTGGVVPPMCAAHYPQYSIPGVLSNALIAAAYLGIPLDLVRYGLRFEDPRLRRVPISFAVFIAACGAGHVLDALGYSGHMWPAAALRSVNAFTAAVSVYVYLRFRAAGPAIQDAFAKQEEMIAQLQGELAAHEGLLQVLRDVTNSLPSDIAVGICGPYADGCVLMEANPAWGPFHDAGPTAALIGVSHWEAHDITDTWREAHRLASVERIASSSSRDTTWGDENAFAWWCGPVGPPEMGWFAMWAMRLSEFEKRGALIASTRALQGDS